MGSGTYLGGSYIINTSHYWSRKSGLLKPKDFSDKEIKKKKINLIKKIINGYSFNMSISQKLLFQEEILKRGSKLNWAKSQPEYKKTLKQMLRKSKKNRISHRVRDECRINY